MKLATARWLGFKGNKKQLMDPSINIYYAGRYLSLQINRYNGNIEKAVIAYNIGNAAKFDRTRYSTKVLRKWGVRK